MPEILRDRELFPFSDMSINQALKDIQIGTVDFLSQEKAKVAENTGLYNFINRRVSSAESFLDRTLYMRGALFTHRVLRVRAEERKINLRKLPDNFGEGGFEIFSKNPLSYYLRQILRLSEEEPGLTMALEAISVPSISLPYFAGAIDVYFPLRNAIENG